MLQLNKIYTVSLTDDFTVPNSTNIIKRRMRVVQMNNKWCMLEVVKTKKRTCMDWQDIEILIKRGLIK